MTSASATAASLDSSPLVQESIDVIPASIPPSIMVRGVSTLPIITSFLIGLVTLEDVLHGKSQYYVADSVALGGEAGGIIALAVPGAEVAGVAATSAVGIYTSSRILGDRDLQTEILSTISEFLGL